MTNILLDIIVILYFTAALTLMAYGVNCYVMIYLFRRRREQAGETVKSVELAYPDLASRDDLPAVITQIPLYNEFNVVERILRAACAMDYPHEKHDIQILDDSNDETCALVDNLVEELSAAGHRIQVLRRPDRTGYKAGALNHGLKHSEGELVAVFDADFVPPKNFWLKILPHFLANDGLGLVQARWGHLNRTSSLLTRAQGMGIDGHFMVEQGARAWNGLFMNFNGTAGVWRVKSIHDAGGWEWDTLTEDMDLSYRMQLAGWQVRYLPDLIVPAEIPEDIVAFKSQQFRWAKGSIQTAIKIFPRLLTSPCPMFKKLQAFFHLTHYLVHPMMLTLAILALPVLLHLQVSVGPMAFTVLALFLALSMSAPSALYLVSQRAAYIDWRKRILLIPVLVVVGVGIAVNNTRAVLEALCRVESGFVRTPKRGDRESKHYRVSLPWLPVLEILLGGYCTLSLHYYLQEGKYLVGPFLAVYAAGFFFVGFLSLIHAAGYPRPKPIIYRES